MKRVLIVDDAMFIRNSLRIILEKHGYEVVGQAGDGEEAIEQYKTLKPDLVTMDVTMPKMDGLEALRNIRAFDVKASVIMVTAVGKEETVREAIMSGAKSFIVKPFNEDKVVKVFEKL